MAPWVPTFIQSCKNNELQPFTPLQFATIDNAANLPRVRTVVFRDFLFHDKKTNVLTFNSDLRSGKIDESFPQEKDHTTTFETCVYFPQTWEQYRFSGQCFVISNKSKEHVPKELLTKYKILSPKVTNNEEAGEYVHDEEEDFCCVPDDEDWDNEVIRQWSSLSRSSKSLYRKPAPGSPLTKETSKALDKIQRGVDGAKEDAGLENFGIVCLCIDTVDYLNLKDGRGGERWIYRRSTEQDGTGLETWDEQEVCP